jgi:TPR repeat protein
MTQLIKKMKTQHIVCLVLATNTIVWFSQAQTTQTNSPQSTQTTAALLQTWDTISNHWGSIPPTQIKPAAEQGDFSAQFYLGMAYFNGIHLVQDQDEAIKWIKSAANQGLAAAQHNLASRYAKGNGVEEDKSQAIAWCQKAAEQGFVKAQISLGWLYAYGYAGKRDYDLAEKWLRKAAEQGSAEAQYQFGYLLTQEFDKSGHQVANFQVAAEWYRKAAEQSFAKAQFELAEMYHSGKLGDDQRSNCIPWFLKAAAQGDAKAQAVVGELPKYYPQSELLKSVDPIEALRQGAKSGNLEAQFQLANRFQTGDGVPKDPIEAFKWMQKAAQQDGSQSSVVSDARYQLGLMYEKGEGVASNLTKAHDLFRSAIEESMYAVGNPAILRLGQMYENGDDVPQNDRKAVEYYSKGGYSENLLNLYVQGRGLPEDKAKVGQQIISLRNSKNTARGCFLAGEIYYQGKLVPKDIAQAADWFNKAATQGSPEAMNRIGEMWAAGMNGAPDPKEAANWYHKAATKGLAEAQFNLGLCYTKGERVPVNPVEAWKWLQLAAEQKFPNAAEERDKMQATMTADQVKDARILSDQINVAGKQ